MSNVFKLCLIFSVLVSMLARAEKFDFSEIVESHPHAVVVDVNKNIPRITEIIYTEKGQKLPRLVIHEGIKMEGRYLVFLSNEDTSDIFKAYAFSILENKVIVYNSVHSNEHVGVSRPQPAVISETINTSNLFKELKLMREKQ